LSAFLIPCSKEEMKAAILFLRLSDTARRYAGANSPRLWNDASKHAGWFSILVFAARALLAQQSVGQQFGSRKPHTCQNRKAPASGALCSAQACITSFGALRSRALATICAWRPKAAASTIRHPRKLRFLPVHISRQRQRRARQELHAGSTAEHDGEFTPPAT
jgi:hypothetical protein